MNKNGPDLELSIAQMELNNLMKRYKESSIPTPSSLVEDILDAQARVDVILEKREASPVVFEKIVSMLKCNFAYNL